jgi:carbonic anhydrase
VKTVFTVRLGQVDAFGGPQLKSLQGNLRGEVPRLTDSRAVARPARAAPGLSKGWAMKSPAQKAAFFGMLGILSVVAVVLGPNTFTWAGDGHPAAAPTPERALTQLQDGNERSVSGNTRHPNTDGARRVDTSKNGQQPFVTSVECSDSRVSIERSFDRGIEDIFVMRVSGDICGPGESGSIEYAIEHLGTPLLVVLGHTRCGAVTAAAPGADVHGPVASLREKIKPAVEEAHAAHSGVEGKALGPDAINANEWQFTEHLLKKNLEARERGEEGRLKAVGALHSLETG